MEQHDYPAIIADLTRGLKDNVKKFSERLDDIRDRIDDTARCYCLVERAFEWTLSTINFMSQFKLEVDPTLAFLNENLQKLEAFVRTHPSLSKDNFLEMDQIAARLKNPKLTEQCAIARARCQEAESLTVAKETTFLKAKFVLVPARPVEENSLRSYFPATPIKRDLTAALSFDSTPFRNSTLRQASIPEMDENFCGSEPPFIDADSTAGTDSVPIGSVSSTNDDFPSLETVSCQGLERRPKGNMKRSLTWQCGEGGTSRGERTGCGDQSGENDDGSDGKFSDEDFSNAERARVNRRESWTVPTSNSHLMACLPKETSGNCGEFAGYGNNATLVMQELIQTEQDYIAALRFVIDVSFHRKLFR